MGLPLKMNLRKCAKSGALESRSKVRSKSEGLPENQVWVVANTIEPDSYDSIILPLGLRNSAEEFLARPYVFYEHEYGRSWDGQPENPENTLGRVVQLEFFEDRVEALLEFDIDINNKARLVCAQIKRGTLNEVSIGFRARRWVVSKDDPEFGLMPPEARQALSDGLVDVVYTQADLMEISVTKWASNPKAKVLRSALRSIRSRSKQDQDRKENGSLPIRKILDALQRIEKRLAEAPAKEAEAKEDAVETKEEASVADRLAALEKSFNAFQSEVNTCFDLLVPDDDSDADTAEDSAPDA